jgi:Protein of unknown function (DUF5818)
MRRICLIFVTALFVATCWGQERQQATIASGQRTITGCVAVGSPGYVLKTDDGSTLQLRAGTDLGAYMGKRVEIQTSWTQTGVAVAAPGDAASAVTGGGAEAPVGTGAAPASGSKDFAGDLHLTFKGRVLGDCEPNR